MFSELSFWQYGLITVALTQMSTVSVTIYLHRYLTHGTQQFKLHPAVVHYFRFIVWLMTGTWPDEWRAIHLWHHDEVETAKDPHSPRHRGIWTVLFGMYFLYMNAKERRKILAKYGSATPQDWLERNLYAKHTWLGLLLMLPINTVLFGFIAGPSIWVAQVLWMPMVAGIINGLGHYWGYRNYTTTDDSRNIWVLTPLAVVIGGEELHNNHHGEPGCAKLSRRWFEFDSGWVVIRLLEIFGLASGARRPNAIARGSP